IVPAIGVRGAIYAAAISYAAVDVAYVLTLRRPLTNGLLLRIFLPYAGGAATAAAAAVVFAPAQFPPWIGALAAAASFLAVVGASYFYNAARAVSPHVDAPPSKS